MSDDRIARGDRVFLRVLDERLRMSAARAGARLACRRGCTTCCQGPFPINVLDAFRLRAGLRDLEAADRERAAAVRARILAAIVAMEPAFPGDAATGRLADEEEAQDTFFRRFACMPCPVLDPATGGCDLYAHRPSSCRTYGLPVRLGVEDLPPCRLCFVGASPEEVESCRVEPDPSGEEDALLTPLERRQGGDGSTIVAFGLARA